MVRSVRAARSGPVLPTSEIGSASSAYSAGTLSLPRDLRVPSSSAEACLRASAVACH